MAPRINKGGRGKDAAPPPDRERVAMGEALKALRELRRQVEANFENVGDRFAEEARRMHYGEKELRNIYGDATPAEAETLREEGVPVERIPWVPKGDA